MYLLLLLMLTLTILIRSALGGPGGREVGHGSTPVDLWRSVPAGRFADLNPPRDVTPNAA